MMQKESKMFDCYATDYDAALARGLAVSGEERSYFAQRRVKWLRDCLLKISALPQTVMDYGCGNGSSSPFLLNLLGAEHLIGTDDSAKSLEIARRMHGSERAEFLPIDICPPWAQFDLVFCNGVFHHIPPSKRLDAIDYIFGSLRLGGLFAFWENNPWNPGTRYVMSRIPFDRDAITLTPWEAQNLLRVRGFEILRTDFLFIFPRALSWFRPLEPFCSRLPLGAQYQILCRKPLS
jgi:SAM-dependent methyltransferase